MGFEHVYFFGLVYFLLLDIFKNIKKQVEFKNSCSIKKKHYDFIMFLKIAIYLAELN